MKKLKLSHCNDSATEFGSLKDRHAHIGEGKIGKSGFEALINDKRMKDINLILETDHDKVIEDIDLLKDIRK